MEAIRKQATRLRDQVAKQQQAVLKQFGAGGYSSDNVITDEAELHQHQKLEKLYISTRAAKHFQRDIVRGVEGYIVTGSKQVEIGTKLSEDSRKYGGENTCTSGSMLSRAAVSFSRARAQMEKERGSSLKALGTQVAEPLRAMVMGAPLEDARHLAQRYDRMRQEAEAQAIEVSKRQAKVRETQGNPDIVMKLEAAESKLQDLKSNMGILGKEAAVAMAEVEAQQQRLTLQRLIAMVEAERAYHQRALQILEHLEGEMMSERQRIEAAPSPSVESHVQPPPAYEEVNGVFASQTQNDTTDSMGYFLGEVLCPYQAESNTELCLLVGDYVVVRKARALLKSLLIIGTTIGLVLGIVGTSITWLFPNVFTSDLAVIGEMHKVWIHFFLALCVTPCILPCEGTLLFVTNQGLCLAGCWSALVGFQWARFIISLRRLLSPHGVLYSEDLDRFRIAELKAA